MVGYTHPVYGQAGLEASLDQYLRGLQGNPTSSLIWEQIVYGTPPPGLDVRLTLDLRLQQVADTELGDHMGAVVLMKAESGEILVMASHPGYDANALDELGPTLSVQQNTPLLNRATQGTYQVHNALLPMITAARLDSPGVDVSSIYRSLGLSAAPEIRMTVGAPFGGSGITDPRVSPLQMAVAAASLSNLGIRPAPRIASAIRSPLQGWVVLPQLGKSVPVFSAASATRVALDYVGDKADLWQWRSTIDAQGRTLTWFLAGSQPGGQGTPLVVVVLLEDGSAAVSAQIGTDLLNAAATP